ncbi:MAG: hypothetical protein JKY48_01260, partial [Flavobacteriales bacterium]|nr:hypothetical protein [Flavobacteriales bacterium]
MIKITKWKFIFIIFIFTLASCETNKEKNIVETVTADNNYSELIKNYPDVLTEHFPRESADAEGKFNTHISYPSEYSATQLFVTKKESKEVLDSIRIISEQLTVESHILIINKYLRSENLLDLSGQYNNYDIQSYGESASPIPNSYKHNDFGESTINKLS